MRKHKEITPFVPTSNKVQNHSPAGEQTLPMKQSIKQAQLLRELADDGMRLRENFLWPSCDQLAGCLP